jgi:exopolyphosphatase/guanosine-5'-triphosphate,3'-diphosphate pyrophosphatase
VNEADVHIFATASLRGLQNQAEVLTGIRLITGILPEVLSGEEEARLDYVGASHAMACQDGLLIDIGGASTELVIFRECQLVECVSIPMGCLSLYHRFIKKAIPTERERKELKREIRERLAEYVTWELTGDLPLMVGVGGTVRAALKLSKDLFGLADDHQEVRAVFVRDILRDMKRDDNHLYRHINKRIPERALTICPGLMILREAMRLFQCEGLTVSPFGVREGYLIDHVLKGELNRADSTD